MRPSVFPQNVPINEKRIAFIERVVTRLTRRTRKSITALITPYPISNAIFGEDIRGTILRYMFPCEGTITKGLIKLGRKPNTGINIGVRISNNLGVESKSYVITRRALLVNPALGVSSGDCLELFIEPVAGEPPINEVWVSFLWIPTIKDIEVKSYLIEELEKDSEEFVLLEESTEVT